MIAIDRGGIVDLSLPLRILKNLWGRRQTYIPTYLSNTNPYVVSLFLVLASVPLAGG
jgi:hypothetical protein